MLNDKHGVTLVEVMIALLVLLFVSLALMQTALVSIDSNMKNVLRDEAGSISETRMADARGQAVNTTSFTALLSDDPGGAGLSAAVCPAGFWASFGDRGIFITKNLRNIRNFGFCTHLEVTPLGIDAKQVDVTVAWLWKGEPYIHTNSTILRAP